MAHPGTSSNPNDFILPDLGEGVHEGELIKWKVTVGQPVKEGDVLAEFETDKALCEVFSPRDGVIATLHGNEGEILKVGNPLVTFVSSSSVAETKPAPKADAKPESKHDNGKGHAPAKNAAAEPELDPMGGGEREDAGTVVGSMGGDLAGVTASGGKALATPAVRRLARDLNVNIDSVRGTGMGGRVLEKDVRAAASGAAPAPRPSTPAKAPAPAPAPAKAPAPRPEPAPAPRQAPVYAEGEETTRIPFRGVRRTIANRLRESMNQAVHFTVMDEADVSALDGMRKKLAAASGEKVSFLPFVCSAICRVLGQSQFRALNATVDEKPGDESYAASIIQHRSVNLGIATDTDNGLMVPVIRDSDRLGVLEIGRAITMIAEMARNRSIPREQLIGSTFTVSNVGSHAGRFATPVINYPEVGILAVGRAREGVVVNKGAFRVGLLLPLSLACDHRVVDGATAALALAEIVRLLQDPEALLTPARG